RSGRSGRPGCRGTATTAGGGRLGRGPSAAPPAPGAGSGSSGAALERARALGGSEIAGAKAARARTARTRMSDATIEATGELGRQADHHGHRLSLSGVATGDDVVGGGACPALVGGRAGALSAE